MNAILSYVLALIILVLPNVSFSVESDLFIVFQAGFNGCSKDKKEDPRGADVYKPLKEHLKLLDAEGVDYDYSVACFPFELKPKTMKYYLDKNHSKLHEGSIESYREDLSKAVVRSGAKNILMVAHSHGAWLAMQQVLDLDFPNKDISLISIDPISLRNCTLGVFFRSLIRNKLPFFSKNRSCQQAPEDISSAQYAKLKKRLFHWSNFYQENYKELHSSEIFHADENYNLDISGDEYENNPHADVTTHTYVQLSFYLRAMEIVFK